MEKIKNTTNYELYELDKQFKAEKNIVNYINEAQNFFNGNQYPNENYKNMIRVTLNITAFSAMIKASKTNSTKIYLTYTADDNKTDCVALQRFDEYNQRKLNIKTNNYMAALNGYVNGTEVTFVRWDEDDTTYKGIYKGGLAEEHMDLRTLAVANPYILDIQKQKWIMFWEDFEVGAVKELVEGKNKKEIEEKKALIKREGANEDEYKNKYAMDHSLVRVYTRFFRVDGEVYFMCSTDKVDLFLYPHPLSRKVSKSIIKKVVDKYVKSLKSDEPNEDERQVKDYHIDYEDMIMNSVDSDVFNDTDYKNIKEKFSLYPFAVFRPYPQNRFFYGKSDIKSLIPIQKGINFAISMMLKCIENNAYNKIFAKPDALGDQVITNEPSQVLYDYSAFTNGWGIKFAESQPLPNGLLDFVDRLLAMTRVVYGFNDVMDGSINNQDMSGYMLQQMIKQSNTAIEQQTELFWQFNIDKAAIRLMYYKHYVDEAKYTYELDDATYDSEEQSRKQLLKIASLGKGIPTNPNAKAEDFMTPTRRTKVETIKNEDLYGVSFDIAIDALQGTNESELIDQQLWDNLLLNGGIQNISPDILAMYLQCAPNISQRNKTSLNRVVENLKQGTIQQLKGKLEELMAQSQELMRYTKALEGQMGYQSQYLKNLQSEFANKINMSNRINQALMQDLAKYKDPKTEGQKKSENATSKEVAQQVAE